MRKISIVAGLLCTAMAVATPAFANGLIVSANGFAQIGVNDDGSLDASTSAGFVGIGYKFTGQGGRTGFNDALTPGCPCEDWGVSYNGATGGSVGQNLGNFGIAVGLSSAGTSNNSSAGPTATFTSNTSMSGIGVTQAFSIGTETASGALFKDTVTLTNNTGAAITNLRFGRAMDWDVPPTEFAEYVTIKGTGTTTSLKRSTDNGFANANPLTAIADGGITAPINADFTDNGPADHGALFVFDFGGLADGASYSFDIFYGAGANETDALALLGAISPELYSLGQSSSGGVRNDLPTFVFAFRGVGGSIVVPPVGVPEPLTLSLFGAGALGAFGAMRRRKAKAA